MSFKNGIIYTILVIIFLCYAPYLPPHVEFDVIEIVKGRPFEGILSPNTFLNNVERLHEKLLLGPESIAFRSTDEIFVGVHGGNIVKIYGSNFDKMTIVANNGPGCAGYWEEAICGRPLGLRFHNDGLLYVTDAYLGVFAVDVDTGKSKQIFNLSTPIEGVLPRLADDLDFDKDGNIYWSDATTVAGLDNAALEIYANPSGRLIKYDIKTKTQKVLLDKLHFANGVQMSPTKDFVLINDCYRKRTLRYWLEGPKAGTSDVFVNLLPGMPDNIRQRPGGGYYIAIVAVEDDYHFKIFSFFGNRPTLKKFLCRITSILGLGAQLIERVIPNTYTKNFIFQIFNLHTLSKLTENYISVVVEVNENGEIIGSLQGYNGQVKRITEAQRIGDNIFLASAFNNYLGRIKIKDLYNIKKEPKLTTDREYEKYEL